MVVGVAFVLAAIVMMLSSISREAERVTYAPSPEPSVLTAPSAPPSSPTQAPVPTVVQVPSTKPTETPSPTVTDPAPGDVPSRVSVVRGDKIIVEPIIIGKGTSFTENGVWNPVPGYAEWYSLDDHPLPCTLSTLRSVIAGHVAYDGEPNVFFTLDQVVIGDIVVVTYRSGYECRLVVTDIINEDKEVLRTNQSVWGFNPESRTVILFTCDDQDGFRSDGHRKNNLAVVATVE